MAYLWDSNILRHYTANHPALFDHLNRVPAQEVLIPVIVYAEQLRGRIESLLKAEPARLLIAQQHLKSTQELLSGFEVLYLDEAAITMAERRKQRIRTRKRYADPSSRLKLSPGITSSSPETPPTFRTSYHQRKLRIG